MSVFLLISLVLLYLSVTHFDLCLPDFHYKIVSVLYYVLAKNGTGQET